MNCKNCQLVLPDGEVAVVADVDEVEKVTVQVLQVQVEAREVAVEVKMEAVEADDGDVLDGALYIETVVF